MRAPGLSPATCAGLFGAVDGLSAFVGILVGLIVAHQSASSVWWAALSCGVAELVGMASGQYQSDTRSGWKPALICGALSMAGCVVPAIPYVALDGPIAFFLSVFLVIVECSLVAWVRPEGGWRAWGQTFGLTAIVAIACTLVALI